MARYEDRSRLHARALRRLTEAEIVDLYGREVGPWNVQGPPQRRLETPDNRTDHERACDAFMLWVALFAVAAAVVARLCGWPS